jgi:hypothetical protein
MMSARPAAPAAPERWVVALADGRLWLHEGQGPEAHDRIVTRVELALAYPRLHAELITTANKDCPRVVMER